MTIRRRGQLHPGALDRHQRFVVWMRVPGSHHIHPFSKNLHAKKKKKKGRGCFNRPRLQRRSNRLQKSGEAGLTSLGSCGIYGLSISSQLGANAALREARARRGMITDTDMAVPEGQGRRRERGRHRQRSCSRKKRLPLLRSPLFLGFLKRGGAGLCRNC